VRLLLNFLEFLTPYGTHSYAVMFGVLLACGFGFPMPEDIVLVTGGILSAHGVTQYTIVNLVCMAGVMVGDGIIFFLGRRYGPRLKQRAPFNRIFTEKRDLMVKGLFDKYGDKVIFMGRFMPGLRTPIFFSSGVYQVPPWKFFALDGSAALISVPAWIWLGFFFGQNLEELEKMMKKAQFGLYSVLAIVIAIFVALVIVKKKAMKKIGAAVP